MFWGKNKHTLDELHIPPMNICNALMVWFNRALNPEQIVTQFKPDL